jgi:hypothetical protein
VWWVPQIGALRLDEESFRHHKLFLEFLHPGLHVVKHLVGLLGIIENSHQLRVGQFRSSPGAESLGASGTRHGEQCVRRGVKRLTRYGRKPNARDIERSKNPRQGLPGRMAKTHTILLRFDGRLPSAVP